MSSSDEESMDESTAHAEAVVIEGEAEDDDSHAAVAVAVLDDEDDDTANADEESMVHDDESTTAKSALTHDDKSVLTAESHDVPKKSKKSTPTPKRSAHRKSPSAKKGRSPAVRGLTIPFRAVKRIMKLDPDIGTVQNEAAILVTLAAELFVKSLAKESYLNAKNRGRGTIR